jgi:ArsR family transcriptional regulator
VALLSHGELCSCHIESALSLSQPNASRHLSILKVAGIIHGRREGTWIYYRLAAQEDEARRKMLATISKAFGAEDTLKKDIDRVLKAKGTGPCR